MANLALVTSETTSNLPIQVRDDLVVLGHSVTFVLDSDISTTDFGGYDAIVTQRTDHNNYATIGAELRSLSDTGKPLLLNPYEDGQSTSRGSFGFPNTMRLTGTTYRRGPNASETQFHNIEIVDNSHAITSTYPLGALVIMSSADWQAMVFSSEPYVGQRLANDDTDSPYGEAALIAIENGTLDLDGVALNSRIVIFGGSPTLGTFNAAGVDILGRSVDWILAGSAPPPTDLEAAALLKLTATATLQQPHQLTADTLLRLRATATIEQPTELSANALLRLVATASIQTIIATNLQADALLRLRAAGTIEQEHRLTASALLRLTSSATLEIEPSTNLEATALLRLVATAKIAHPHHLTGSALLRLVATADRIAQDHNLRAAALLRLFAHDGYVGPGTGLVIGAPEDPLSILREGDTFNIYMPWAGLEGVSGVAHVMSRRVSDDREDQELELSIVEQPDPSLVPRQAGGVTPTPGAASGDVARKQSRQAREIDRIVRSRTKR